MPFTMEEIVHFIGIFGAGVYLGSYALLQLGMLKGDSYTYSVLNILAPSCVMISLLTAFNMSSAIIQTSWIIISIVGSICSCFIEVLYHSNVITTSLPFIQSGSHSGAVGRKRPNMSAL